jgi:hypothetical protein
MISQVANLNWVAVLIAFVAYSFIGWLWFTILFSKPYKVSLGKANEILPNHPIFIVGPMFCTITIVITTAVLIYALNVSDIASALELGLLIGLGYLVANTVNIAINPNMPRPLFYSLISGAYHLVCILIACVILVAMK